MTKKRILLYLMDDQDVDAARAALLDAHETAAFHVGEVEEEEIETLAQQGLMVVDLGPADGTDGDDVFAPDPDGEPPAGEAAFYLVRVHGVLLSARRERLEQAGAVPMEFIAPDRYLCRMDPAAAEGVTALPFVRSVRPYGRTNTVLLEAPTALRPDPYEGGSDAVEETPVAFGLTASPPLTNYDVAFHDPERRERVAAWLTERGVSIVASGTRKLRFAAPKGAPFLDELRGHHDVRGVEECVEATLWNEVARVALRMDAATTTPLVPLTGANQIIAVADTGLDTSHPDFPASRIVELFARGRPGDSSDPHGHGTHVAGSALGNGAGSAAGGPPIRGVAPDARLVFQSLLDGAGKLGGLPLELGELLDEAYKAGARIHNNSWGYAAASHYRLASREVDEFIWEHPDMLVVFAAGNEGAALPGSNRVDPGFVDWLSLGAPATAKNALTVGASRSPRTTGPGGKTRHGDFWPGRFPAPQIADDLVAGDPECMAGFSSRGPCYEMRIKPDLVAPGTDILSARSSKAPKEHYWGLEPTQPRYAYMGGTSMAAPLVSGCAALVREFFMAGLEETAPGPSAALLKATLVAGTRWLRGWDAIANHGQAPNYHQGFGCVDLSATLPNPSAPRLKLRFADGLRDGSGRFTEGGQLLRYVVEVEDGAPEPLRICMAYTDFPGVGRQNHVNLLVEHQPTRRRWVGNAELPENPLKLPDPFNNVQVVRLEAPEPGRYLVQLTATNILNPQDVALVVTGNFDGPPLEHL